MVIKFVGIVFLGLASFVGQSQEYNFFLDWEDSKAKSIQFDFSWSDSLQVKLENSQSAIFGRWSTPQSRAVSFTPNFPFTNDLSYVVMTGDRVLFTFVPKDDAEAPKLLNIYPLTNLLPENFLKFYLSFDQPMAVGRVYNFLHLYQGDHEVENAFISLQPELWDEERKVLTLWIDPGRVKKDLLSNQVYGPVLQSGKDYTLVVEKGLRAASGKKLEEDVLKTFNVGGRDEIKPNLSTWQLSSIKKGTKDVLTITTTEPMDYSLASFLAIEFADTFLFGAFSSLSDASFTFVPEQAWKAGTYQIKIDARAEDLVGNNFNRLFDRDISDTKEIVDSSPLKIITFVIEE